jgi:cell division protein FtsW (lipid II flippase)
MGYALIIAFVLLAGAIMIISASVLEAFHLSGDSLRRWRGLAFFTLITFGWIVKQLRRFWSRWIFWISLASLLIIHLVVMVIVLRRVAHWLDIWFLIITVAETPVIIAILEWMIHRVAKGHHLSGASTS